MIKFQPRLQSFDQVPLRIRPALVEMLEATKYAGQTNVEVWQFSVDWDRLCQLGLNKNDLRWLVRQELVKHKREVTVDGDENRAFRIAGDMTFSLTACFVLTDLGRLMADEAAAHSDMNQSMTSGSRVEPIVVVDGDPVPIWDSVRRELRLTGKVVKRFKWIAINQERVLAAFQEEGWPFRIDDPLSPRPGQESKRRLSDTIKCLNRKQGDAGIRFRGDGTGEGIVWDAVVPVNN